MADDDTPGAVLTPSQREYLRGDRSYDERSYERTVRSRIRERIRVAMFDFSLLLEHISQEELQKSVGLLERREEHKAGLSAGLQDGLAFLYAANVAADPGKNVADPDSYTLLTQGAIQRACRHAGLAVDELAVEISIEGVAPLEEFDDEDLAKMPIASLRSRYFAGLIDEEDFDQAIRRKIEQRGGDE